METISLKIDKGMSKKISLLMKEFDFSTKTEFIREAIRKNISNYELEQKKKKQWEKLLGMKGAYKGKTKEMNDDEWEDMRNNLAKKFAKEQYGIKI
ncbi:MAG: ribbon-helix-helix domain-containing protein [Candidatus ainarchaeum sp.]|nr:ribbon-helix-helix domain-containing protein [Candidatus ainarchaeum sp.]